MVERLRQHIEKITPISDDVFADVLAHFTRRSFRKHQYVVQAGFPALEDCFVLSGCLKAYFTDRDGKDHILQFALEDWWVSDYQAYFGQLPASIHVDCLEPCELLCLTLENREKLCAKHRAIEHFFRRKSNAGYVALQQRILSLLTTNAKERYDQLLQQQPQLFQRLPKTLIAAYLGVSRETLSRLHP